MVALLVDEHRVVLANAGGDILYQAVIAVGKILSHVKHPALENSEDAYQHCCRDLHPARYHISIQPGDHYGQEYKG